MKIKFRNVGFGPGGKKTSRGFLLVPNMVLAKINIHEHRARQTYESYTFQLLIGFWFHRMLIFVVFISLCCLF